MPIPISQAKLLTIIQSVDLSFPNFDTSLGSNGGKTQPFQTRNLCSSQGFLEDVYAITYPFPRISEQVVQAI